jgi:ribosomal protein S27E
MFDKCLGPTNVGKPTIIVKKCPQCGAEVEFFSDERQVKCDKCGASLVL